MNRQELWFIYDHYMKKYSRHNILGYKIQNRTDTRTRCVVRVGADVSYSTELKSRVDERYTSQLIDLELCKPDHTWKANRLITLDNCRKLETRSLTVAEKPVDTHQITKIARLSLYKVLTVRLAYSPSVELSLFSLNVKNECMDDLKQAFIVSEIH